MIAWGINALNHDASLTVFKDGAPIFASHSERFSRIKNDSLLNNDLIEYALTYGKPDQILWSDRPLIKKARQLITRDIRVLDMLPRTHLKQFDIDVDIKYIDHHHSHAAAAAYTAPFDKSLVFVFDSIGEFNTMSVWKSSGVELTKIYNQQYPHSLGLFYSAFTKLLGLKPNEEEFILMGMAAYGEPTYKKQIYERFFDIQYPNIRLKENLHTGVKFNYSNKFDLAASVQDIYEELTFGLCNYFKMQYTDIKNACFSGGCALNCVANSHYRSLFDNVWVFPNAGDAGNSYGAGLAYFKQKHIYNPYIGYDIQRRVNIDQVIDTLKKGKAVGIANGKAEFGPRALGNRSLLADPRGQNTRENVNLIKRREKFRPFAPAILEEHFHNVFNTCIDESRFMNYTFKNKLHLAYPGVTHRDKTSRVQTVSKDCNTVLRPILEEWYRETGIPLLLNTSLNIKGYPLVNTFADAHEFNLQTGITIF